MVATVGEEDLFVLQYNFITSFLQLRNLKNMTIQVCDFLSNDDSLLMGGYRFEEFEKSETDNNFRDLYILRLTTLAQTSFCSLAK